MKREKILKSKDIRVGKIFEGPDQTWVKLMSPWNEIEMYEVQVYADGFDNFMYGVDYNGAALYYFNGDWVPYSEVEGEPFPDFVKIGR